MTDQFTSLTPAAIREIIAHVDESIAIMTKQQGRLTASELQVKSMLTTLKLQLADQLKRQKES